MILQILTFISWVEYFFEDKGLVFFASLLLTFIAYFVVLIFVLLSIVIIHRQIQNKLEKRRTLLKDIIHEEILEYLFNDEKEMDILLDMVDVKSAFVKQSMVDFLEVLHDNLKGKYHEKLKILYQQTELADFSMKKIENKNWSVKVKGFRELSRMDIDDVENVIHEYIYADNPIVALEAKLALIRLSPNDPLWFLDTYEGNMSVWAKVNIFYSFKNSHVKVPDLRKWLQSDNRSVLMFILVMIKHYQQTNAFEDVKRFVYYSDERLRHKAYETLAALNLESAKDILMNRYPSETIENKKIIISCLRHFSGDATLDFYLEHLNNEDDFDLKLEIAYGMAAHGDEGEKQLIDVQNSKNLALKKIAAHVSDTRINYRTETTS